MERHWPEQTKQLQQRVGRAGYVAAEHDGKVEDVPQVFEVPVCVCVCVCVCVGVWVGECVCVCVCVCVS
jgi:hypothetical protein